MLGADITESCVSGNRGLLKQEQYESQIQCALIVNTYQISDEYTLPASNANYTIRRSAFDNTHLSVRQISHRVFG